jgi:hypothetical protein
MVARASDSEDSSRAADNLDVPRRSCRHTDSEVHTAQRDLAAPIFSWGVAFENADCASPQPHVRSSVLP